jgi:hydroxymethylpyrimidine pyrophosphatase-like HAD family hydrolase
MSKYKIVFCDIDGTIADDEKIISKETIDVCKLLKEKGIYVVLVSGKPYKSVGTFSRKCYASPYLIASNGAVVRNFESGTDIFNRELNMDIAVKIIERAKEERLYHMLVTDGNIVVEERKFGMEPNNRAEIILVDSVLEYLIKNNSPVSKIGILDQDVSKLKRLREELVTLPNTSVLPVDICPIPESFWKPAPGEASAHGVDIMATNVTKKEGIIKLCEHLGIDVNDTIGIGDGLNDLDMFEVVGYRVAMGNAEPEIKSLADEITVSNNASGVGKILKKLFLDKE